MPWERGEDCEERTSPFTVRERDEIQSAVFMALGEASMCWSYTPQGIFDSEHALKVGHELMSTIERIMLQEKMRANG